jgi:hypothetical protein
MTPDRITDQELFERRLEEVLALQARARRLRLLLQEIQAELTDEPEEEGS